MKTFGDRVDRFTQYKQIEEERKKRNTVNDVRNDVHTKRSMLDRGIDLLSIGQYISAGIVKGVIDKESTVIGNVASALQASNPFTQGNESGEIFYSDVIETAGWKPETLSGKVTKGTLGLLGDIFLDPLTYMTLGISATLKGGKGALGAAKVADKIIDIDKATDVVRKFAQTSGEEMAEDVIKAQAEKLLKKHNQLIGVSNPRGIELSLANSPFGKKIFGNLAQAKKTIATGEDVAKFGDKTIAPVYQKLRSDLMKSKFADLFSKNSKLYKMALNEPDELYKFMRSEIMQKRQAGELIKEKKLIMAQAAKLREMNFSPEETKIITDLLQDPATRRVIYNDGIAEEKAGINIIKSKLDTIHNEFSSYVEQHTTTLKDLEELINMNESKKVDVLEKLVGNKDEIAKFSNEFEAGKQKLDEFMKLRKTEIEEDLMSIPTPTLSVSGKLKEVNDVLAKKVVKDDEITNKLITTIDSSIDGTEKVVVRSKDKIFKAVTDENKDEIIKLLNKDYNLNIHPRTFTSDLQNLFKKIPYDSNTESFNKFYNKNIKKYDGYNATLNSFIANKFGYKSFADDVTKPLKELNDKRTKVGLSLEEERKFNLLLHKSEDATSWRNYVTTNFKDYDSLKKYLHDEANATASKNMQEIYDDIYEVRRDKFAEKGTQKKVDLRGKPLPDRPLRYKPELGNDELEFIGVDVIDLLGYGNIEKKSPLLLKQLNEITATVPEIMKEYHIKQISNDVAGYSKRTFPYIDELPEKTRKIIYNQARDRVVKKPNLNGVDDVIKKLVNDDAIAKEIDNVVKNKEVIDSTISSPIEYSDAFATDVKSYQDIEQSIIEKTLDSEAKLKEFRNTEDLLNKEYIDLDNKFNEYKSLFNKTKEELSTVQEQFIANQKELASELYNKEANIKRHQAFLDSVGINPENYDTIKKLYQIDVMSYDDKIKETVKLLRDSFLKIGSEEVGIGKIEPEAFEAWANNYLPHILTEQGQDFVRANADSIAKTLPGFDAKKIGYGRTFNPFSKERTLKNIKLDGEFIPNPTIDQLNRFFTEKFPELKDNKVFIDDFTDLYVQRALKHVDVMYDHKYMNEMLGVLGTKYSGDIKTGQKLVMNYGVLRDNVLAVSRKEFGRTWDEYDIINKVSENLGTKYGIGSAEYIKGVSEAKYKYMDEITARILKQEYSLPPNALTDLSTPMIEITPEQAKYISELKGENHEIFSVNDLVVDKANQSRKYQIQKDNNQLLNIYDKFTHFIKLNQTTVMPGFHVRNKIGNMFNSYLEIGKDALDPKFQKIAHNALMKDGNIDDILLITRKDGTQVEKSWREIYESAQQYGILDEGFFEKDLGTSSATNIDLFGLNKKFNPTNTKDFILYEAGAKVGTHVEGMDKLIHFASQVSRGMDYQEAYESVNKYLFNYGDLTLFEQQTMKRIFPYYTWLRKNAPLQLETLIERPEIFRNVNKVMRGVNHMSNQEDRMEDKYTSEFAQDWMQMPFKSKEGNPIIMNPSLPMNDINKIPDVTNVEKTIKDILSQMNPLIKVPMEFATNENFFMQKEIFNDEDSKVGTALDYILSQGSYYNTGKNIINDKGTDKALRILNALTGVKFSEYEYEKYKGIMQSGGFR